MSRDPDISQELPDGCLVRGNPPEFFGPSLVSVVDILGISAALVSGWGNHPESALQRFRRIKNAVPRDDAKSQVAITLCDPVANKDLETYLSVTRTLSDSIVSMLAMPSSCSIETFNLRVFALLFAVRLIWRQTLQEGFVIRGAVEFGPMFWDTVDFTGPGLIWAYKLEEKEAKSCRILVGPRLLREIARTGFPIDDSRSPASAMTLSEDGRIILDPHFMVGDHQLPVLQALRKGAADAQWKYDELIRMLESPKEALPRITPLDLSRSWESAGVV